MKVKFTTEFRDLIKFFTPDPEKKLYRKEVMEDLYAQAKAIGKPVSFFSMVAWLDFAFNTDPKLHPEFTGLLYLRLGLTVIGAVVFILNFVPYFHTRIYWLNIGIAVYLIFSCSFFTGRLADDPNYVSGYQLLILMISIAPFRFRHLSALLFCGILVFIGSVLYYKPNLSTFSAKYSMNNLVIAYAFAFLLGYLLNMYSLRRVLNHVQLSKLKVQQDGDYFLTSLLLQPFYFLDNKNPELKVSSYISQKKKFTFKNYHSEIGGDINISHDIILSNKPCLAFTNADAMGKSIQGAGGVIVYGTAFEVFLERNRQSEKEQGLTPAKWLAQSFQELHGFFEKFQGSMLMSGVIGVIEPDTGLLYFVNAEHPYPVLYRDGVASFIGASSTHFKLGSELAIENRTQTKINKVQLYEGDVLFIGSDGKDDLDLNHSGFEKSANINTDENLFLKTVEEGHGVLDEVIKIIYRKGAIIDDLSILRIEYPGKPGVKE